MTKRRHRWPWLLFLLALACAGREQPAAGAAEAAEQQAGEDSDDEPAKPRDRSQLPASQRMLGKWRMNVAEIPDTALTEDMRKLKQQGKAAQMRVEYTVTDREFILDKWGAGGRVRDRWFYEVLNEDGDALMLERTDKHGEKQQIPASVEGGKLRIGTGNGIVPLERIGS